MTYKVLDLFGGIGGFRLGLEKSKLDVNFIEYIEKDKYAVKSYNEIFQEQHKPTDATDLKPENLQDFDILCAGFPCQAFSIAGDRKGFEDTRGTLFFEIARIAREKLPKILLLENVKGLLNHADGETFEQILKTLDELGYDVQWQVLNSKYHGVPQNRERVFIVAHRRGESWPEVFPFREPDQRSAGESKKSKIECINPRSNHHYRIYRKNGISPRLMSSTGGGSAKHPYVLSEGIGVRNQKGDLQQSDYSAAVDANYFKGIDNHGARTAILDWHGHKDKPPVLRDNVPTLRAESHGHQPKLLQKSHDWRENNELREFTEYSPTIRSQMGDNLPLWKFQPTVINHQLRPESRPSVSEEGQGGESGILFNNNYSYALSSSPHYITDIEPVITPDFKNKDQNKTDRVGSQDGAMFTVDGTSIHGVTDGVRIRKLTPRECWRLQGFPDEAFEAAEKVNSDTQLYKQAGNSVTVNVVKDIGNRLAESL